MHVHCKISPDFPRNFSRASSRRADLFFFGQVLWLPRITPQDMQRQTCARVAEFRRINHIRGPEANSKTFTTIMSEGHRLALPDGGGLKRQLAEQDLKIAGQYFAMLQNIFKTCAPCHPPLFICNILPDTPTLTPPS